MKIGQRVVYIDKIVGSIKGTVSHKSNDKAIVRFNNEIYGDFQKSIPVKQLYKCRN